MKKRNEENYVKHTYKFYKDRKNDPKWRPSYLKARQQRIIWIIIGIAFILLISSISFFAYSYSNAGKHTPTESFNKSSNQSSSTSKTSSSSKSSSSSSQEVLKTMDDLDLNTKIALLAQAYFDVNTNTTILQASQLAMSNSWDNGPIEWYDAQGTKHLLNVRVDGDTITYTFKSPQSGQPMTLTASVDTAMTNHLISTNAIHATEAIAAKVVVPAELKPNGVMHDGGHAPEGKGGGFVGQTGGAYNPDKYSHITQQLTNHGFRYSLISYDGMDVDTAMKNGAPQNLAHDSTFYYYFIDNTHIQTTAVGAYNPSSTLLFTMDDSNIMLGDKGRIKIPYKLHEGKVFFSKPSITHDGHTYVYEFVEDPSAKNYIDSKK